MGCGRAGRTGRRPHVGSAQGRKALGGAYEIAAVVKSQPVTRLG